MVSWVPAAGAVERQDEARFKAETPPMLETKPSY